MDPAPPSRQPLAGVRVLHCGTVYAAPITAMLLGDFGAEVIKVEHPRGDPARTHGWNVDGHGLWWKVNEARPPAAGAAGHALLRGAP